ncbi:MAG: ArsR/SmtB family transcription factor [Akkermansiaceae bacterium]
MELQDASNALSALSQTSRLELFRLLVISGDEGLAAGNISVELGIPKPTLSFHLKELSTAGLITSKRHGRSITYKINIDGIRDLMAFLTDDCCQGRPELCNLRDEPTNSLPTNLL